jgi:hypothetical protein
LITPQLVNIYSFSGSRVTFNAPSAHVVVVDRWSGIPYRPALVGHTTSSLAFKVES